ncbi:MAG: DUF4910 domain-containing protein [Flavobacteriales bacterium]|nr:DUF4910 domain-containing protein [Flavobacteriales bacterium]
MPLKLDQELKDLEGLFDELWPICRSLTGQGVRDSLDIINQWIPLEKTTFKTGDQVFDWTIPKEWNIKDAYIITPSGEKIADFKVNNLHVLNYSTPVNKTISYQELKDHIYTLPGQPDVIPYITSYYKEKWGFCLRHTTWTNLPQEGNYQVVIESSLEEGELEYAEAILPGSSKEEILFSTYICHPSMANNELSGPLTAIFLYRRLLEMPNRRFTYRFLFAPETIGVIAYLSKEGMHLKEKLAAGYVLTCCGDRGNLTFKESKRANTLADRVAKHVLEHSDKTYSTIPFAVGGSDERQYCSPGFNLPVGSLMRTPYQKFKEYHTSGDNKDFISFSHLQETIEMYERICKAFELNDCYFNKIQYCEPQLGKRGLYPDSIGAEDPRETLHRLLDFLSYADGETALIDIADRRKESIFLYEDIIKNCTEKGLLIRK